MAATMLSRDTVVELLALSLPAGIVVSFATWRWSTSALPLLWYLSGIAGLFLLLTVARCDWVGYEPLHWPRPTSCEYVLIGLLVYNPVLLLGVVLSRVVLSASGSTVASVAAGAILPVWFLKHLGLLVFVDE